MHTATTNVPGPQQPVQTLGRRMLESYPFVPVVGSIRIVVAIFSYDGGLYFGVTGDYDGAPDIEVLTAGSAAGWRICSRSPRPRPAPVATAGGAPLPRRSRRQRSAEIAVDLKPHACRRLGGVLLGLLYRPAVG